MKHLLFFSIVIWTYFSYAQVNHYQEGDVVDNFTVTDIYGQSYTLYDLTSQGKYVFLDFFYVDCASCQSKISILNEFWDKYGCGEYEIFCLAINKGYDNDADVENFENLYGGETHHAPAISGDGGAAEVTETFDVNVFSTFCLIAPDNKLLKRHINPVNSFRDLENALLPDFHPTPMPCTNAVNTANIDNYFKISVSSSNLLTVGYKGNSSYTLYVYDITGKQILVKSNQNLSMLYLPLKNTAGIYLLKILSNRQLLTRKIYLR